MFLLLLGSDVGKSEAKQGYDEEREVDDFYINIL